MKLGISYPAFNGIELLEYALRAIRSEVDFVSVIYQDISFFGNSAQEDLLDILNRLADDRLIDMLICYEQDFNVGNKENETRIRNLGVDLSREIGCTHHISADVDEFYLPEQLRYVKDNIHGYDCSLVRLTNYYKHPCWQIKPEQNQQVTFIHPVDNYYDLHSDFPFPIEISRKPVRSNTCRVFTRDEFVIHHMTYVRKNLRDKFANSPTGKMVKIEKFMKKFDIYKLGDLLCIPPEFLNRKTVLTPNIFNIKESIWEQHH